MSLPHHAHTVSPGEGKTANLGVARMRVLAAGKDTTDGAFTLRPARLRARVTP